MAGQNIQLTYFFCVQYIKKGAIRLTDEWIYVFILAREATFTRKNLSSLYCAHSEKIEMLNIYFKQVFLIS